MKTLRLKIAGIGILSTAVIVLVGVFWFSKPQSKQAAKSPKPGQPATVTATTENGTNQRAEKLYQMALRKKNAGGSSERKYHIVAGYCRQILELYPDSPQADKATELLQEVPERYQRLSLEEIRSQMPSKPAVRKSRSLRRRLPRRDDEWHIAVNNEMNPSN